MIVDSLFEQLFQRLSECRHVSSTDDPFAGLACILLIGDFTQLPPGIGGAKRGLMGMMLRPQTKLARHLQKYSHATFLEEQERGKGCLWQTELVTDIFRSKTNTSIYPITKHLVTYVRLQMNPLKAVVISMHFRPKISSQILRGILQGKYLLLGMLLGRLL
jgi:hypothetical protein